MPSTNERKAERLTRTAEDKHPMALCTISRESFRKLAANALRMELRRFRAVIPTV